MDYDEEKAISQSSNCNKAMTKLQVYKNLLFIGLLNLFQYSATISTNALITSTAGNTLGNIVYCLNYFFSAIFSLLSIAVLSSRIKEKEILWISNIALVIFAVANLHISYYTLITASFFHGFAVAMAFVTSLVYVKKLATHYAETYKLDNDGTISLFGGILFAFSLGGYLVGNGTTAGILTVLKSDNNGDTNSTGYDNLHATYTNSVDARGVLSNDTNYTNSNKDCQTIDGAIEFTVLTESVIRGVVIFYSILALLTTAFIDDFDKYHRIKLVITFREKVTEVIGLLRPSIKSAAKVAIKKKMCLTFPMFITIAVSNGFIFATYTKIYIAECIGVHFVGYIVMTYGVTSSLGSSIFGKLLGLVNYNITVITNVTLHSGIILFLIVWERQSQYVLLFLVPVLWGFCNGAWLAISYSFVGTNFGKDTEVPFALYRIVHMGSIGVASLLNFMPLKIYQIILCIGFIVVVCLHLMVKRLSKE